jgi:hypothetical protein
MERKPRAIRLNDQEWEDFKGLLGTIWLREQIAKAKKIAARNTDK